MKTPMKEAHPRRSEHQLSRDQLLEEVKNAWFEAWHAAGDSPDKPPVQAAWIASAARRVFLEEEAP